MEAITETISGLIMLHGPSVVYALVILIVGLAVCKIVHTTVRKTLTRAGVDATLVPFISKMAYYLSLTFVMLSILARFGIQTTSIIAVLGGAVLAVGLALQGTLSNFAAGVMLLVFRPFEVGHFVDAGGTAGTVIEIGIFSTTLHSPDNVKIIVPNSSIYGAIIKNFSANETRRNDLVMGIDYGDNVGTAMDVIRRVLEADDRVLKDPEPLIALGELADSSVNILVRPWCKASDYWSLRFDLLRTLKEQLEAAGCSIPFPQTDVHLHQVASGNT
jgi:small conductance mechanosensitive channel